MTDRKSYTRNTMVPTDMTCDDLERSPDFEKVFFRKTGPVRHMVTINDR